MAQHDVLPPELAIRTEALGKRYGPPESSAPLRRPSFLGRRGRSLGTAGLEPLDEDDVDDIEVEQFDERPDGGTTWALRDVSIDVTRGSGIAVLGASGSGKSTLLRVLARITPPTAGRALVRGRVIPLVEILAALLQSDLAVHSNVVGLAQLFGVPREVARRQTEDIVAFAGLGTDLGTPLKQLSSDLRRRLTIATALCLDADVILVEDFVARGERKFAARALERLIELRQEGVTLVLATRDLDLARRLCDRAVHLGGGAVVDEGPIADVIERYDGQEPSGSEQTGVPAVSSPPVAIVSAAAWSDEGPTSDVALGDDVTVRIELDVAEAGTELRLRVNLAMGAGSRLSAVQPSRFTAERAGRLVVTVVFPGDEINGSPVVGSVRCDIGRAGQRAAVALREAFTLDVRGLESAEMAAIETGDVPDTVPSGRQTTVELYDVDWRAELL